MPQQSGPEYNPHGSNAHKGLGYTAVSISTALPSVPVSARPYGILTAAAEQLKSQLDARLAAIEAEARTKIQAAIKEAQAAKDDMLAEARARVEDTIRRGQDDLAREREKILAEIREQTVDLSIAAAGKIIGESLDQARHRKLVNDFIDQIGSAKP